MILQDLDLQDYTVYLGKIKLFFGPEVEKYLDQIYKKGAELHNINFTHNNPNPNNPRQTDYGRKTEILHWFVEQQKLVTSVFHKYLDFTKP